MSYMNKTLSVNLLRRLAASEQDWHRKRSMIEEIYRRECPEARSY